MNAMTLVFDGTCTIICNGTGLGRHWLCYSRPSRLSTGCANPRRRPHLLAPGATPGYAGGAEEFCRVVGAHMVEDDGVHGSGVDEQGRDRPGVEAGSTVDFNS